LKPRHAQRASCWQHAFILRARAQVRQRVEEVAAEAAAHRDGADASVRKDVRKLQKHAAEARNSQQSTEAAVRELANFAAELEERMEERLGVSGAVGGSSGPVGGAARGGVPALAVSLEAVQGEVAALQVRAPAAALVAQAQAACCCCAPLPSEQRPLPPPCVFDVKEEPRSPEWLAPAASGSRCRCEMLRLVSCQHASRTM
jgi:hypothetical protein